MQTMTAPIVNTICRQSLQFQGCVHSSGYLLIFTLDYNRHVARDTEGNCSQTAFLPQQIYLTIFFDFIIMIMYPRLSQVGYKPKQNLLASLSAFVPPISKRWRSTLTTTTNYPLESWRSPQS